MGYGDVRNSNKLHTRRPQKASFKVKALVQEKKTKETSKGRERLPRILLCREPGRRYKKPASMIPMQEKGEREKHGERDEQGRKSQEEKGRKEGLSVAEPEDTARKVTNCDISTELEKTLILRLDKSCLELGIHSVVNLGTKLHISSLNQRVKLVESACILLPGLWSSMRFPPSGKLSRRHRWNDYFLYPTPKDVYLLIQSLLSCNDLLLYN
ncbi:hypothetical protein LZ554_004563 [Drepanopeziza brunnea f. sp. 'monogermtubi']|nr:hypothetical protein LZ554_004563 [Drepanopeziza brunnea f. sp. 'monogermtubi']